MNFFCRWLEKIKKFFQISNHIQKVTTINCQKIHKNVSIEKVYGKFILKKFKENLSKNNLFQMEINEYFNQKRNIYNHILAFIDSEDEIEENFACFSDHLESSKFFENESEPMTIFNILLNICNDHHRTQNFFYKIDKILSLILSKQAMSKPNISQIIKNKHIFLFLVQKKIIKLNKFTIDYLISTKQHLFYFDEIKPLLNNEMLRSIEKEL